MKALGYLKKHLSFILCVFGVLAARWSLASQYRVPTGSMEPTIHVGDHIFVNKMAYDLKIPFTEKVLAKVSDPKRGDIVVFLFPKDPSVVFVKRMIGLPGDHIHIKNGFISVNGKWIEGSDIGSNELSQKNQDFTYHEHWLKHDVTVQRIPDMARAHELDFVVPENMYFCMGDNRDNSDDSRSWGFVPRKNLKGRASRVLWSVSFANLWPSVDIGRTGHSLD